MLHARHVVVRGGYGISHTPNTGRGRDPIPDFGTGNAGNFTYTRWQGTGRIAQDAVSESCGPH